MTMIWSIGPIIAPGIGGYLQHYFGWQANFYFLAIYSLLAFFFVLFLLPETSKHRLEFHPISILQRYKSILMHWHYFWSIVNNGVLYISLILFGVVAPFLLQHIFHYSAIQFGHVALLMGFAWFLGTMTNRFLIHVEINSKTNFCYWAMFIVALIMLIINLYNPLNPSYIIAPLFVFLWLGGIVFPNYFARGILYFPNSTGSANSLFGAFVFFIGSIGSGIGALLPANNNLPLAFTYFILICVLLIIHFLDRSRI